MTILVTGATGELGSKAFTYLRDAGSPVRGISRRGGENIEQLDLLTNSNLKSELAGVDAIVHCAQGANKSDVLMAHRLAQAARSARVRHLVAISIVGIDEIPLGYYKQRALIEKALVAGFPRLTIQRATQFHSLVATLFSAQKFSPVVFVPKARVQPIEVEELAARLGDLALGEPQGRAEDIGGPEIATFEDFFTQWNAARPKPRRHLTVRLPGKTFAALASGANLTQSWGAGTFAEYLATHPSV